MRAFIEKINTTKEIALKKPTPLKKILQQLNINTETVIVSKNNNLITLETQIENKDTIQILSIISGG